MDSKMSRGRLGRFIGIVLRLCCRICFFFFLFFHFHRVISLGLWHWNNNIRSIVGYYQENELYIQHSIIDSSYHIFQ